MKILILHRISFEKAYYSKFIDHAKNDVYYYGKEEHLQNIPDNLICHKQVAFLNNRVLFDWASDINFDRIVGLSEYDLLLAGQLRDLLNIPGSRTNDIVKVRDKVKMKEFVAASGIRVPSFKSLTNIDKSDLRDLNWDKIVLKPIDGASSSGVEIMNREEAFRRLLEMKSNADQYEIEEFIPGPIFHVDGWIVDGKVVRFVVSEYVNTCLDFAKGLPLGSYQRFDSANKFTNNLDTSEANIYSQENFSEWLANCLNAIQIHGGAFHLEGIQTKQGPVFLEVGHRVGGAGVAETFELKTGINLYEKHISFQLQDQQNLTVNTNLGHLSPFSFGWFVYPGRHQTYDFKLSPFAGIRRENSPQALKIMLLDIFNSKLSEYASSF